MNKQRGCFPDVCSLNSPIAPPCYHRSVHLCVIFPHNVLPWLLVFHRIKSKFINLVPRSSPMSDPCLLSVLISCSRLAETFRLHGVYTVPFHLWASVLPARNTFLPTCMSFPFVQMSLFLGSCPLSQVWLAAHPFNL